MSNTSKLVRKLLSAGIKKQGDKLHQLLKTYGNVGIVVSVLSYKDFCNKTQLYFMELQERLQPKNI